LDAVVRIRDLNWMQLETYLRKDDRIVLPVGSTEQHAYLSLETDMGQGFGRVLVVNGHGGNTEHGRDWARGRVPGSVVWHELWEGGPDEIAAAIDPHYDDASWSENFPWTRLPGVAVPEQRKPPVEWPENGTPETWREALGDGSFGGLYQRSSKDEDRLWEAAVQAIRERLEPWGE